MSAKLKFINFKDKIIKLLDIKKSDSLLIESIYIEQFLFYKNGNSNNLYKDAICVWCKRDVFKELLQNRII